jgi:hypothetical protein
MSRPDYDLAKTATKRVESTDSECRVVDEVEEWPSPIESYLFTWLVAIEADRSNPQAYLVLVLAAAWLVSISAFPAIMTLI